MSKTTEHIIKNNIDVRGYDGKDDEYFTGPIRLKIAYLPGIQAEVGGQSVEWLKSLGHVVLSTELDYTDGKMGETELLLEMFEPDVIIGNSYAAWDLGSKLNVPTLLFNKIGRPKNIGGDCSIFKNMISSVSNLLNDR